jgi:thiol:disulfide interchange protein DsbD
MLLFVLGLSLFGVFSLPIFDLKISSDSHPHWQSFASGLLATLLATPCSGPLLGGVLAWAIRQPLPVLALTVVSVGIGMAMPYGVLAFNPRLIHLLPRPGTWTNRLEQLLGFFLMGSVAYLATLLPGEWVPAFLFNLLAVALAAWLWGQIGHLRASRLRRGLSRVIAVSVVVLAAWWGTASIHPDSTWESFDPEKFTASLGKEPLLLEFTADWCPSCKAVEHTTLTKKRMEALRKKYNVRTIRVDLTRDSGVGKELLKALNSTSIPVLALFPVGKNARQPLVVRDLVTPTQLKEAASRAY